MGFCGFQGTERFDSVESAAVVPTFIDAGMYQGGDQFFFVERGDEFPRSPTPHTVISNVSQEKSWMVAILDSQSGHKLSARRWVNSTLRALRREVNSEPYFVRKL